MNQSENDNIAAMFTDFLKQMQAESDRGCVIVTAALIDDILVKLISCKLTPSIDKKDELLKDSSPIGNFSARIDMSYRLGLIRSDVRKSFHLLRKTRNEFAHVHGTKSFESSIIKSRVVEIFKLNHNILESIKEDLIDDGCKLPNDKHFVEIVGTRCAFQYLWAAAAAYLLSSENDISRISVLD